MAFVSHDLSLVCVAGIGTMETSTLIGELAHALSSLRSDRVLLRFYSQCNRLKAAKKGVLKACHFE